MAAGISLPPRQVQQHMPPNSPIAKGLQGMDEKDQDTVEKLHEISFNIALQGPPFTTLRSQVENEKLHRVNLKGSYENEAHMEPIKTSLMHLFYFYKQLSKKYRELKNL